MIPFQLHLGQPLGPCQQSERSYKLHPHFETLRAERFSEARPQAPSCGPPARAGGASTGQDHGTCRIAKTMMVSLAADFVRLVLGGDYPLSPLFVHSHRASACPFARLLIGRLRREVVSASNGSARRLEP